MGGLSTGTSALVREPVAVKPDSLRKKPRLSLKGKLLKLQLVSISYLMRITEQMEFLGNCDDVFRRLAIRTHTPIREQTCFY